MTKTKNAKELLKYVKKRKKLSNRKAFEEVFVQLNPGHLLADYAEECEIHDVDMIVEAACKTNSSSVINRIAEIDVIELKHLLKFKKIIFQCSGIWWLGELIKFCSYCQKKSDDIIIQED